MRISDDGTGFRPKAESNQQKANDQPRHSRLSYLSELADEAERQGRVDTETSDRLAFIRVTSDPNRLPARLTWVSSVERCNGPWFPSDPNAVKNTALDGGFPVEPAAEIWQRKAQGNGGVGDTDRTRR